MVDDVHKYKGVKGHHKRKGLGRLRRANTQDATRVGGLERHDEDSELFDSLGTRSGSSHGGETLLARFNRVARSPASAPGEPGEITGFSGSHVMVLMNDGHVIDCSIRQALKKQIAGVKNPLCVGDRVRVTVASDSTGAISGLDVRTNQLERADSHNRSLIHVFAANIDCLAIIVSVTSPDLKPALIDRYLVIAAANRIPVTVVMNKCDIGGVPPEATLYRQLGYPVFTTSAVQGDRDPGVTSLRAFLLGKRCVFAGQSGVGKSSLMNALFPGVEARVGAVANAGHGRHTTTSACSYLLPGGGRLIDTPGVRECAVTGLRSLDVALLYDDLATFQDRCHFRDCTHLHEPNCAVRGAVETGAIALSRYASYVSIVTEDLADSH